MVKNITAGMTEVQGPPKAHSFGVTDFERDTLRMDCGYLSAGQTPSEDPSSACEVLVTSMEQTLPDTVVQLVTQLEDAIRLESNYNTMLQLPSKGIDGRDITEGIRDGSAHVLRCLKVWYDLPSDVLFVAINYMDRFLTKMKAQAKHMACISISSFSLAAQQVALHGGCPEPDLRDLALISQSKCTPGDLERMEGIIEHKLEVNRTMPGGLPITSITFLRLYHSLFLSSDMSVLFQKTLAAGAQGADIWQRLEIVLCDSRCASFRPSVLAIVLLYTQLQAGIEALGVQHDSETCAQLVQLISFAFDLQKICQISTHSFSTCLEAVTAVLTRYNAQSQMPHRQRLVWKLSHRTRRLLRPIDRLSAQLPTIEEHGLFMLTEHRSRSGSVSSEESSESEREDSTTIYDPAGQSVKSSLMGMDGAHWLKLPY